MIKKKIYKILNLIFLMAVYSIFLLAVGTVFLVCAPEDRLVNRRVVK